MPRQPGPGDYLFLTVPEPIQRTKRVTRLERDVWSVIYTWQRLGRRRLTVKRIAEMVGSDRRGVQRALENLEEEALIGRRRKRTRGMHVVDMWVKWPAWLAEEGARALIRPVEHGDDAEEEAEMSSAPVEVGAWSREDEVGWDTSLPGGESPPPGEVRDRPQGGGESPPPVRGSKSPLKSSASADEPTPRPRVKKPRAPAPGGPVNEDEGEEVFEENVEARTRPVARVKENRGGGRNERPPSGPEHADTPSQRWEFNRWREKSGQWVARDLVGYWANRHLEVRGVEDPELRVTSADAPAVKRLVNNVRAFVRTWLKSDFRGKGREAVDLILRSAEDAGMPVSLRYFFTPSSSGALDRLAGRNGSRPRGKGKELAPHERNDASGADPANRERWRRQAEELVAEDD